MWSYKERKRTSIWKVKTQCLLCWQNSQSCLVMHIYQSAWWSEYCIIIWNNLYICTWMILPFTVSVTHQPNVIWANESPYVLTLSSHGLSLTTSNSTPIKPNFVGVPQNYGNVLDLMMLFASAIFSLCLPHLFSSVSQCSTRVLDCDPLSLFTLFRRLLPASLPCWRLEHTSISPLTSPSSISETSSTHPPCNCMHNFWTSRFPTCLFANFISDRITLKLAMFVHSCRRERNQAACLMRCVTLLLLSLMAVISVQCLHDH